ncbi:MAG TPA: polymer-forming cytoskeletal protein [Rhodocyclaceae bacterium]
MGADASIRSDEKHTGHASNLVAAGMVVAGDIVFSGSLRIDGEVKGNVIAVDGKPATLVIGVNGSVDGIVEVTQLILHGAVSGQVKAKEFVKIHSTARANCDVEYATVEVQAGAIVQGLFSLRTPSGE